MNVATYRKKECKMHREDARMSPDVAVELILRLDINAELRAAGRELTLTDMEATGDLLYYIESGRHLYFSRGKEQKHVRN